MRLFSLLALGLLAAPSIARADEAAELVDEAKELLIVGACADGTPAKIKPESFAAHCKAMKKMQAEYKGSWQANATAFFAEHTPKNIPKTVVYPFAGGDLASALAVFPDADEITTIALEPAGDPRALAKLSEKEVGKQLELSAKGMDLLYRRNYSHPSDMIDFMRGAKLPTQLIFSLSALSLYGYERPTTPFLEELAQEAALAERRAARRRRAAAALAFPFETPRPGQLEIVRAVEEGIREKRPLLLQAPTGLGKTVGISVIASAKSARKKSG